MKTVNKAEFNEQAFNEMFDKKLKAAERRQEKLWYAYYRKEYDNAANMFISQGGKMDNQDINGFFKYDDMKKLYINLYTDIALDFAKWYAKSFEKFNTKFDSSAYGDIWAQAFSYLGSQVAAQRVTLVSGTAKKTLIAVTKKLMADPEFNVQNEVVSGRILRGQFAKYSLYQAKRLVRTESTYAANFGNWQSAKSVFNGRDLMKTWYSAHDDRVRDWHLAVDKTTIPENQKFLVNGEQLFLPGDRSGSASNVINCRCRCTFVPKPDARVIGAPISSIGFGIAGALINNFEIVE